MAWHSLGVFVWLEIRASHSSKIVHTLMHSHQTLSRPNKIHGHLTLKKMKEDIYICFLNWNIRNIGCVHEFWGTDTIWCNLKLWVAWQVNPIASCRCGISQSNSEQKVLFFILRYCFWIDFKWAVIGCFSGGDFFVIQFQKKMPLKLIK